MAYTGGGTPLRTLDTVAREWLRATYPAPQHDKTSVPLTYAELLSAFKAGWVERSNSGIQND